MDTKIAVLRAVLARATRRGLNLATAIAGGAFVLLLFGTWALTYFFSDWWWLLALVFTPLFILCSFIILSGRMFAARLAPPGLTRKHYEQIDHFVETIQRLLVARGISWPMFLMLNIKDLLLHQELRTLKNLIADTASLKRDFLELEEKLQSQPSVAKT